MERMRESETMGNERLRPEAEAPVGVVIGEEDVKRGMAILEDYRRGKSALEERIVRNEEWYRLRHWNDVGGKRNSGDPEPTSAWLLNMLMNKHADAMDNYPEASVLPREQGDQAEARMLSDILPTLLEQARYEDVYSDKWWKKLKAGTGCTAVTWDPRALNGLGEVSLKVIDILNLFWEPGIADIQDSANLFRVDLADTEALERQYPELNGKLGGEDVLTTKYYYDDTIDTSGKTSVVDWYYKRTTEGGKTVTHLIKFAAGTVLFASENEESMKETGFYAHGKYPFVLDQLFPVEGSPAGFGFLDICKDPQLFIDKLNQIMLKGAAMARPRWFIRADGQVNEQEYADMNKDFIHWQGAGNPRDDMYQAEAPEMPGYLMNLMEYKVNELKETSGNTDFGQGVSSAGVTAASAIAALQEAGGKLSRDMLKTSYRAFTEECYLVIELIRQFYDVPRWFRIVGQAGQEEFVQYSNANIRPQALAGEYGQESGSRVPVFDIKVRAYKANAFSRLSQNELAKEFFGAGFFNPQLADQALACIEMMDFEGKDAVERKISQNGTLYQQVLMMQQQMQRMAAMLGLNGELGMGNGESNAAAQAQPRPAAGAGQSGTGSALNAVRDRVNDVGNPTR